MKRETQWTAGRIVLALAHKYWASQLIMTEFEVDGGRADFVTITKHHYLTEIEIKLTVLDWKKDLKKVKWDISRPCVSRFFYAIPETLKDAVPNVLPEGAGIMVVSAARNSMFRDRVSILRPAKRFKAQKISDQRIQRAWRNSYFRYWNQQINTLNQQRRELMKVTSSSQEQTRADKTL